MKRSIFVGSSSEGFKLADIVGIHHAFFLPAICYVYIVYFAIFCRRITATPQDVLVPAEPVRRKSVVGRVMLAVFLLLLGALSTIAISWGLAFQTELADQPALSGQGFDGPRSWRVQGWGGFGSIRLHSIRDLPAWSVLQAAGPPDTPGQGDIVTAWASATTDGQKEWLLLDYARAVTPTKIDVHETYNPGALEKVRALRAALDARGSAAELEVDGGIKPENARAWETNIVEDSVQALPVQNESVRLEFRPWQVRTLLVETP